MRTKNLCPVVALLLLFGCQKKDFLKDDGTNKTIVNNVNANRTLSALLVSTTWYVDNAVSASGDGKSLAHAFKTIQEGADHAVTAGDVVLIQAGDYKTTSTSSNAVVTITSSGAAGNPITYKAYNAANKPKIYASAANNLYKTVMVQADHIVVDGLEVIGDNSEVYTTTPIADAKHRTNGIQVGANNSSTTPIFDVVVKNCKIHDFPGAGIGCKYASQLTINNNEVFNNAWYSLDRTSGISILLPTNAGVASNGADGDATHPKNLITNNICYSNECKVENSDGNGIIVDVNRLSANLLDGDFRGYTRVENNICANNGGAGINVTEAQNVEIINNVTRNNRLLLPAWGEVFINNNAYNIIVSNNIFSAASSIGSGLAYYVSTNSTVINFDYNLFFPVNTANNPIVPGTINQNGHTPGAGYPTSNANLDPLFVAYLGAYETAYMPLTSPTYNEFRVSSSSPAVNTGTNNTYKFYAYNDFLGTARSGLPDKGAFEYVH